MGRGAGGTTVIRAAASCSVFYLRFFLYSSGENNGQATTSNKSPQKQAHSVHTHTQCVISTHTQTHTQTQRGARAARRPPPPPAAVLYVGGAGGRAARPPAVYSKNAFGYI
jgi:hypothetical protein